MRPVAFFDPRSRAPTAPGPLAQQRTNGPPKRPTCAPRLGLNRPVRRPADADRRIGSDGCPAFSPDQNRRRRRDAQTLAPFLFSSPFCLARSGGAGFGRLEGGRQHGGAPRRSPRRRARSTEWERAAVERTGGGARAVCRFCLADAAPRADVRR